ncbi:MAG: hypothetical protein PVF68_03430 [Acidobacteriota bacterium]
MRRRGPGRRLCLVIALAVATLSQTGCNGTVSVGVGVGVVGPYYGGYPGGYGGVWVGRPVGARW